MNLQAFPKGAISKKICNYDEYVLSQCSFVVLVTDVSCIEIYTKDDEDLHLYYLHLFKWLQDLNWPGSCLIYDRLLCVSDEYLLTAHKYSLSVAKKMQDSVWEKVLRDFLVEYIQKGTLSPEEIKELN